MADQWLNMQDSESESWKMSCKMKPIIVKVLGVQPSTYFELLFHIARAKSVSWEVVGDPFKPNLFVSIH